MASTASSGFEFAFNNEAFSDRVLLPELEASSCGDEEDPQEEATGSLEATGKDAPRRKRKRKGHDDAEASVVNDERIVGPWLSSCAALRHIHFARNVLPYKPFSMLHEARPTQPPVHRNTTAFHEG